MLERKFVSPVDPYSLIVATRGQPEMQQPPAFEVLRQEDVTAIELGAIRDNRVYLRGGVSPDAHPFKRTSA